MRIALPFTEAIALATSASPLPDMVQSLTCEGSTIRLEIDLREVSTSSLTIRLALAAAGTVSASARLDRFAGGVATFVVTAHARGLPAHKLLHYLVDPIADALRNAGLPDGLVTVERSDPDPLVLIDVQKAVASRTEGLTIESLQLVDAVIHIDATVGAFRAL